MLDEVRPATEWARLGERRPAATVLRIASYNVHRCVGSDLRRDSARVARVIRELGCDTVALQEVDNMHGAGDHAPQLEHLAAATRMTAIPGWTMFRADWPYGNALLTRREIVRAERHDLSLSRFEPRGALHVELAVPGGNAHVLVTHLGLMPGERRHQVRKLIEIVRSIPRAETVVLLGDINEWLPSGRPLRWLHGDLGRSPGVRTFPVWMPLFALDRVWVRPRDALLAFEAFRSATARQASDHFPVRAGVRVGPDA